jgi:hypothetical protein
MMMMMMMMMEMETEWFRDRIPVVARFSTLVLTGPRAQLASYKIGTGSLSRG